MKRGWGWPIVLKKVFRYESLGKTLEVVRRAKLSSICKAVEKQLFSSPTSGSFPSSVSTWSCSATWCRPSWSSPSSVHSSSSPSRSASTHCLPSTPTLRPIRTPSSRHSWCEYHLTRTKIWAVVVGKWSVCLPSISTIQVRIPLKPTVFFCKFCVWKERK